MRLNQLFARSRAAEGPLDSLIDDCLVAIAYQPVVDLQTGTVFAYEALARPQPDLFRSPPEMIEAATKAGRVGELGRLLRRLSVEGCSEHPLFINIDPNEFDHGFLVRPDDPMYFHHHPVFLEITEAVPLGYFEQCQSVLAEIRRKGMPLIVDDLGSGYSNLKYISDLHPDIVKLDRGLIEGLECGTRTFQLVRSIVNLCRDMGAKVVAEGIETVQELEAVREAGADFGQGYLLARPAFPPPLVTPQRGWHSNVEKDGVPNALDSSRP